MVALLEASGIEVSRIVLLFFFLVSLVYSPLVTTTKDSSQ